MNGWIQEKEITLIVNGARQTGKTYSILQFGQENFKSVLYVNFERDTDVISFFDYSLEPQSIISLLENRYKMVVIPDHTLIFFDKIQDCPKAITSLKYFCEYAKEYYVIACGSYRGVSLLRDKTSYPVGKVSTMDMFPLDFE